MTIQQFPVLTATRSEVLPVVVSVCLILASIIAFAACAFTGVGLVEW